MKIEDIDVNKVALFVEQEMERRLSWAANALTVEERPPRAIDLRDADVIEADMGKSEAARAIHIIYAFVAGSYSEPMAVDLAFRFVWRWIYAPPFISTTGADGLGWDDMAVIPIGDDERAKELAFLLRSVRSYFAPKRGQEREKADASEDTLDDDIDLVTAGQRRLSIPQRRAWGRVAKAALSDRKEIVLLRARIAELEAKLAATPSGHRVAALLAAVGRAIENTSGDVAGMTYTNGSCDAYKSVRSLILQHIGEPTAIDLVVAEVLALPVPGRVDRSADAVFVIRELIRSWLESPDTSETGRAWVMRNVARAAIAGILACDAPGVPTAGSSIARRLAEEGLRGEDFRAQAGALAAERKGGA